MTSLKQKSVLLVGAGKALAAPLVQAFRTKGYDVHCIGSPFSVPTDGSGVVSTKNEIWLSEEMVRVCQNVGKIDILINCIALEDLDEDIGHLSFTAVYASVVMQLNRALKPVLPGMIIRQSGQVITLVAGKLESGSKTAFHAAITAAASVTDRINSATVSDNIRSNVLFHRGPCGNMQYDTLADCVMGLVVPQPRAGNARVQLVTNYLKTLTSAIGEPVPA